MKINRLAVLLINLTVLLSGLSSTSAPAKSSEVAVTALSFQTHADFFSNETKASAPLDPQVFVSDAAAQAGVGPQQITHVSGFRNALKTDASTRRLYNANGLALNVTVGNWLGAGGDVVFNQRADGTEKITVILSGLIPAGTYSLFENHFDQRPTGFSPLDGTGTGNSFEASKDGKAVFTVLAAAPLTHNNAVLVVYHSDGQTHGKSRGIIGVNAHHQLIAQP